MKNSISSSATFSWPETWHYAASPNTHRTLWISDLHLGTKGCQAESLVAFLSAHECDHLYLVGDIIDGWQLGKRWYWTEAQSRVVQLILEKARSGTRVTYIPGNHDAGLRAYGALDLAGIEVLEEVVHTTATGKRLLVLHGDQFDVVVRCHRWLAHLGDFAYQLSLVANRWFNFARQRIGLPYWSLSAYLKQRVKDAVSFVGRFEEALIHEAERRGVDGIVCGHIHKAELREVSGVIYANDGDWVESCTALAEDHSGKLSIVHWEDGQKPQATRAARASTNRRKEVAALAAQECAAVLQSARVTP